MIFSNNKLQKEKISIISDYKKLKRFKYKYKEKKKSRKRKSKFLLFLFIIFFSLFFILLLFISNKLNNTYKYKQDDITIISAYYKMKSKHKSEEYYNWINNIVLLNKSIVFFSNKEFMPTIKELRPKELYYKTVFIELEMEKSYSNKNFYKEFQDALKRDFERSYHSVPLYLIWAEKASFVKKVILRIISVRNAFIELMLVISEGEKMICKNLLLMNGQ